MQSNLKGGVVMEDESKPTPVMFDHCVAVYERMVEEASDEGDEGLVYEGHLTKLFQDLNKPGPYYTTVMNYLRNMGCAEQIRRGGGSSMSRWKLITAPTEDAFNSFIAMRRPKRGKVASLEQQIRDLNRRVLRLESQGG